MERLPILIPDTEAPEQYLDSDNIQVLQYIVDGFGDKMIGEALDIPVDTAKNQIVRKMQSDNSLFEFLVSVDRLPFTSENMLTHQQMVALILTENAQMETSKVSNLMGIDHGAVGRHVARAKGKIQVKRDLDVPRLEHDVEYNMKVGLARGIYVGLRDKKLNLTINYSKPDPKLSYCESKALFLVCAGMSYVQIGSFLDKNPECIKTYMRRIKEKLGVNAKKRGVDLNNTILAKGLEEMMRMQKTI